MKPVYLAAALIFILTFLSGTIIAGPAKKDTIANPVVAEFGKYKVTLDEYKIAYLEIMKQPQMFDSKQLRTDLLDNLIATKLMASEAAKMGMDKDEQLQNRISAYKNKCLRKAHFQNVIQPKIKVDESQIRKVYKYEKEQRRVCHLFFQTESAADSAYEIITKDSSKFGEMAKVMFSNDTALANSGGCLGWVYWDELDYNLAMAAFNMPLNELSRPVKSKYGYHLLKVTGYQVNPLLSEYDYQAHMYKAKLALEYQMADEYSYNYIGEMLKKAKVTVYTNVMKLVKDNLQNKFTRKPTPFNNMAETQLNSGEIKLVETTLWDSRKEVMATINGKKYTVEDFIGELTYVPYDVIHNDFTGAFNYAVRDFLLTEEAKKLGLGKDQEVQTQTNLFSDNFIAIKLKRKLVSDVKVSEDEIKKYYDENQKQIKGAPYNLMHPIIENQLTIDKQMNVVPEYVNILTKNLNIKKNLNIINSYYDNLYNGNIKDKGDL